jgi:charged multivesicular body protein 4
MALKKKKMYELQAQRLDGAILTLETQIMTIEGAITTASTIEVMKEGANTLKNINVHMYVKDDDVELTYKLINTYKRDVGEVEETMQDLKDLLEDTEELGAIISNPINASDFNDKDLEDELDALVQGEIDDELEKLRVFKHPLFKNSQTTSSTTTAAAGRPLVITTGGVKNTKISVAQKNLNTKGTKDDEEDEFAELGSRM